MEAASQGQQRQQGGVEVEEEDQEGPAWLLPLQLLVAIAVCMLTLSFYLLPRGGRWIRALLESESAAEEESSPSSERGSVVDQRAPPSSREERMVRDETGLAEAAAARLPTGAEEEGTSVDDQGV